MWHGIQTGIQTAEPRSRRSQAKILNRTETILGFPCSSAGKESTCSTGDLGSIPKLGRFPGEGKGYPLQYSGLENSTDCIVHGVTKSRTRLTDFHTRIRTYIHTHTHTHTPFYKFTKFLDKNYENLSITHLIVFWVYSLNACQYIGNLMLSKI